MKYKKVGGARQFKPWKEWSKGDFVEGIFTGTSIDNYEKTNYHIEVSNYEFSDGTKLKPKVTFALNENGSLAYQMESVEEGSQLMVEYDGTDILEKGKYKGKEFHTVTVSVAEAEDEEDSGL